MYIRNLYKNNKIYTGNLQLSPANLSLNFIYGNLSCNNFNIKCYIFILLFIYLYIYISDNS